jgi:branched-chain amino acid transport system ATP-binding protein
VRNVSKSFGRLVAVGDVSFNVEHGEIFGIAGPNGAGKTTLFNVMTGIPYHPDSGQVWLENQRIDHLPAHKIARLGVARTFQRETAFSSLTVRENIELALAHASSDRVRRETTSPADLLDAVGLRERADDLAGQLPLYQKKRLMLASAMALRPRVLLLDEPASGLTRLEVKELDDLIRELNQGGVTVILIEHVLPLLLSVSHRVIVMDHGAVLAEGAPDAIVNNDAVIEAYFGRGGRQITHASD